jgi:hypothetical protein
MHKSKVWAKLACREVVKVRLGLDLPSGSSSSRLLEAGGGVLLPTIFLRFCSSLEKLLNQLFWIGSVDDGRSNLTLRVGDKKTFRN